ncbi:MAG: DUF11 domain-containing protein [Planctomycetia bacterium]|nr:DUF11 domain-containing protein [Planctomycetia bacterium]
MSVFDTLFPPQSRARRHTSRASRGRHSSWSRRPRNRLATLADGESLERRELLAVDIVRTSANLRFSVDLKPNELAYGEYQAFEVTNDGSLLTDVWVRATNFSPTQRVQLGPGEDGLFSLGDLGPGAANAETAFIYMVSETITDPVAIDLQPFTVEVWQGIPGAGGSTLLTSLNDQFEWVGEANKENSSSVTTSVTVGYEYGGAATAVPVVGGTMTMTVTGDVKNKPDRILFSPATTLDWPADAFVLEQAVITYSKDPQLPPDIIFEKPIPPASTPKDFTAVYTFQIAATTPTPTPVTPMQYTANGIQDPTNRKFEHSPLLEGIADIPAAVEATALVITKSGTTTAVAGSATVSSYTITVTSTGEFASQGVTVTDTWPAGFTKLPIVPPPGTSITGETATGFIWNIGTLAAGTSKSLTVSFTVPATTTPGPYVNTAVVTSTTPNPNPNTATATTTVVNAPLTITKGPNVTVVAGTSAVQGYSIVVTNTSGFTAEGVTVVDAWPSALARQSITPPGTTTITASTPTGFTWNIGTMTPGQSYTLTVNYTVPKATAVGAYTNTATLSSTTTDPGPLTSSAITTVVAVDLAITKVGDSATVTVGTSGHWYRITVTNTNTLFAAENVTVVDTWPAEFPKSPIVPPAGTSITGETATGFTWNINTLLPGATVQLQVGFSVPLGTPLKSYTNTAVVSSTTQDPGEKTAIATTLVDPATTPGLIVSSDDGCNRAFVQLMSATGAPLGAELRPYGNVCGGIRTTAADINGDGVDELIVAPGRGIAGPVKAYTLNGVPLPAYTFYPYGPNYRGGIELAAADVNNNGRKDIITGMSLGIGTVNVYTVIGGVSLYRTFRGTPAGYAGGVRIAAADFGTYDNGVLVSPALDGKAEVVVGPNAGTQARVAVYDMSPLTPVVARTILPFGPGYRGGVTLTTGNYDGDATNVADILVGAGIGGQSVVNVFNAQTGGQIGGTLTYFSSFGKPNAAVNLAALDLDGDGTIDNLYGVQGLSGGGGTTGVRRVQLGVTPQITTLGAYVPPLRIRPINLQTFQPLKVMQRLR